MNFLNIKNIHDNSLAQFKVGLVKNTAFKVLKMMQIAYLS